MTSSLAEATVDLQALRVTEAEGGVKLAELQQTRADNTTRYISGMD